MRIADCGFENSIIPFFQYAHDLKFEHARFRQYKIRWQWDRDNHFAFKQSAISPSINRSQSRVGESAIRTLQHPPIRSGAEQNVRVKPLPRVFSPQPLNYDQRILLLAFFTGLPGALVGLILLWKGGFDTKTQWTLTVFIVVFWLGCALALRERVVTPLQTLSNLLAALREGDYSIRGRATKKDDPLGDVVREVNALGSTLRTQRLGAMEAALARTVMSEIQVAVFAFDSERKLRLVNRAGERLLARPAEQLLGRGAEELRLDDCLDGEAARTLQRTFPGALVREPGRWGMRRSSFRQDGKPHHLIVIADLSRALREEERLAWQRLVRVLGHELNNSLAPIKSIAGSLESLMARTARPSDWEEDLQRGLAIISSRSEALNRFMTAYAQLAKLPQPDCIRWTPAPGSAALPASRRD